MDDISSQSDSGYYAVIFSSQRTEDEAGYILLCPSDHFIYGDPANLQAFADAAKECIY